MRLTRTAILSALLAASLGSAALAAPPTETPAEPAPTPEQSGTVSEKPNVSGGVLPLLPTQNPDTEVSGGVLPLLPEAEAPAVARGVAVEELPLLVTEPPKEASEVEIPVPVTGGNDSRLNPFSPLLLPQPPQQAAEPARPAEAQQPAQQAAQQPAPAITAPTVAAPAPRVAEPTPAAPVPLPQARVSRPGLPASLAANLRTTVPLRADLSAAPLPRALATQMGDVSALGPASALAAVRTPTQPHPARYHAR